MAAVYDNRDTAVQRLLRAPVLAPRLATALVVVVFSCFGAIALLHIVYVSRSFWPVVRAAAYLAGLLGLQLAYISRPRGPQPRPPAAYLALGAQAALVYLPVLEFGQSWVGMPGFLAGSVLLLLPPHLAWSAFTLIVASMGVIQADLTGETVDIAYLMVSTVVTGLITYGLTTLSRLIIELHAARTEHARMAVAEERLRFARDLHDLLGYSLSAITLKTELTHRLVLTQPAKAQQELSEVLDISRRALTDVRSVASGYRELSLETEAQSARSVLADAEVEVYMDLDYGELPVQVRTVLATVLREGVTNVLRHSKAEQCEITVRQSAGQVRMDIRNDGVPDTPPEPAELGGSGIRNLSARVAALGGRLVGSIGPDGWFGLQARVPIPVPDAAVPAAKR
jgi:two-component system sensor histidine kinase DesK